MTEEKQKPVPAPRYDDVFYEGTKWLNGFGEDEPLAEEPKEDEEKELLRLKIEVLLDLVDTVIYHSCPNEYDPDYAPEGEKCSLNNCKECWTRFFERKIEEKLNEQQGASRDQS